MTDKHNGNKKFNAERYQLKLLDGHNLMDSIDFGKDDLIPLDSNEWRWKDVKEKHICFVGKRVHDWLKSRS